MSAPLVDVVVAVHSPERAVERAVASVLSGTTVPARVTVVCHNVPEVDITERLGEWVQDRRVRLFSLRDGIPSPAGPFNLGLDAATAPFTAVLGSDDELEPGALDSWVHRQRADHADVVIPRLKLSTGGSLQSLAPRPFRVRQLDGVRDRLAYRTAQLGLVSRTRFPNLRFTTGLRTGEDVSYGLQLWFSHARISFDRRGPGYLIHTEGSDRTTISRKKVSEDFAFLDDLLTSPWTATLTPAMRESIAVKLLRTHVMDALKSRYLEGLVEPAEEAALSDVIRKVTALSATSPTVLSRRDRWILDAVLAGTPDADALRAALSIRTDFRRPSNLLTQSATRLLHREAPLRFLAALACAA